MTQDEYNTKAEQWLQKLKDLAGEMEGQYTVPQTVKDLVGLIIEAVELNKEFGLGDKASDLRSRE